MQIFMVVNELKLKNNLVIWSHWIRTTDEYFITHYAAGKLNKLTMRVIEYYSVMTSQPTYLP